MRLRRSSGNTRNEKKWLVTFSDMILIMLVFFIMLFSMSVVDAARFQALMDSFQGQNLFNHSSADVVEDMEKLSVNDDFRLEQEKQILKEDELETLMAEVQGYIEENDLGDMITATRKERGVELVLQDQLLFDSGEAYIVDEAEAFLDEMIIILGKLPNHVEVEGHTDDRPIDTYRYPSNWELSSARASSVIRYLIEEGDLESSRFLATGYGDTRPIVSNDTTENMQQNRRVVVLITDPGYNGEGS
ncbi:chemotaxis protein MotB [Geomicrobium halophilum]|uniref:Chemotaxis protein MotB n=1 Tax=Geomicrobium halophilum TaxID=549000 RepID=A0A841PW38_9BACL|nr:flagellar motor protein MotS [Geomicrobium halophilum]MBB6448132.1 chemotaxis protein MotB [Geomicrobium halophilum]